MNINSARKSNSRINSFLKEIQASPQLIHTLAKINDAFLKYPKPQNQQDIQPLKDYVKAQLNLGFRKNMKLSNTQEGINHEERQRNKNLMKGKFKVNFSIIEKISQICEFAFIASLTQEEISANVKDLDKLMKKTEEMKKNEKKEVSIVSINFKAAGKKTYYYEEKDEEESPSTIKKK